jgi:hydrocephalus-inducing protein
MELEAETDRELLCDKIIGLFNQSMSTLGGPLGAGKSKGKNVSKASVSLAQDSTTTGPGAEAPTVESIALATYVCDFGNVVVGIPQKKSFRLTNCGRLPVQFQFRKEALQRANISIESTDKNMKILPNCSALFNVTFTTQTRRSKFGKMREIVPIEIKGGPQYEIEFRANLTQPELSMSSENLDFGKVAV